MDTEPPFISLGVCCGACGGSVYMETCEGNGGPAGHEWVVAGECQQCGARHLHTCPECHPPPHVCDEHCAHTIYVGYVHVLADDGGCVPDCPHPEHL